MSHGNRLHEPKREPGDAIIFFLVEMTLNSGSTAFYLL